MGVTELGRMLGNDPNLPLSMLYGLGVWEAGRRWGGHGPAALGLAEGGGGGSGEQQQKAEQQQQQ